MRFYNNMNKKTILCVFYNLNSNKMLFKEITECRICQNKNLIDILDLWTQALTWIFPNPSDELESWPLALVKCSWEDCCGLLQLKHNYDLEKLYGDDYGYRSGLNQWMVRHLWTIVDKIKWLVDLKAGDLVIDIASNDGTLLKAYWDIGLQLLWIDPTAKKFAEYYSSYVDFIPDFFSVKAIQNKTTKKAKAITSISMFYDLPKPLEFVEGIKEVLDDNGIRVLEQSYMPTMLDIVSYDTICHEHLEYYALKQIKRMIDKVGMKIIDVILNDVNGWSFQVVVSKNLTRSANNEAIAKLLEHEEQWWYSSWEAFIKFKKNIEIHKKAVLDFFTKTKQENKKVLGYGASTKWNVTLQYCGITKEMLPYIAEVNDYKFGRTTPGTKIPIISEKDAHAMNPDYFFVLPRHFRKWILEREKEFLVKWWHFVFPLPTLEIV